RLRPIALLMPQGVDRVQDRRFEGRDDSEDHSDAGREAQSEPYRPHGHHDPHHRWMQRGYVANRIAQQDADGPADDGEHHRLSEKLAHDVPPPAADALAQADLPRPFGDADQHNVHDADAADDKGDADDA